MNFLSKMERKLGKYTIHGLMRYIVIINVIGAFVGIMMPDFYFRFLTLDFRAIFGGQVWRLFTFVLYPGITSSGGMLINPIDVLFFAIRMYLYYMIGNSLENSWGAFRFNLYYFSGIIFTILASFILYLSLGISYPTNLETINQAMFLAFAVLFPNIQLRLYFIIPIKVKWLGILSGIVLAYEVFANLINHNYAGALYIVVGIANFLIFFFATRNYKKISPKEYRRKAKFRQEVRLNKGITKHRCAICGRSEEDDETLEFRFCSRCDGNYEYCMEHLFSHTHVKKQ